MARAEVIGVRPAARESGVAESTVRRWREHPELAQMRAEKAEEVAADVWAGFQAGLHRMVELLPTTEDIAKVAIATGVMFDKYALMTGQATARTESRALTDDLNDHERATLRELIDGALAASAEVAEGDPV